jgi:hypothetical protein
VSGGSLILDSSLLVLFVVGTTNRSLIERHKRLKAFSVEDFDLLCGVIALTPEVVVTPNTLTETSSLLHQIDEPARSQIQETFRRLILATGEEYVPSRSAVPANEFPRLGLTDVVLLGMSQEPRALLTTDLSLYLAALERGVSAVNFNHLRLQAASGAGSAGG